MLHVVPLSEMLINMINNLNVRVQKVDDFGDSDLKQRAHIAMEKSLNNIVEIQNEVFE